VEDTILEGAGVVEPRLLIAFLRRRRRLREWVEVFPKPGGTRLRMVLNDK